MAHIHWSCLCIIIPHFPPILMKNWSIWTERLFKSHHLGQFKIITKKTLENGYIFNQFWSLSIIILGIKITPKQNLVSKRQFPTIWLLYISSKNCGYKRIKNQISIFFNFLIFVKNIFKLIKSFVFHIWFIWQHLAKSSLTTIATLATNQKIPEINTYLAMGNWNALFKCVTIWIWPKCDKLVGYHWIDPWMWEKWINNTCFGFFFKNGNWPIMEHNK